MSDYFSQLRTQKELIKMREAALENWREAVLSEEEHPFVDVMPECGEETPKKKSKKKDKKEEEKKEEEVKEGFKPLNIDRQEKQMAKHLDNARKAVKDGGDYQKHVTRHDNVKSPLKRNLDLSAQKNRKAELKRREKGETEE